MSKEFEETNIYKAGYLPWKPINFFYNIKNFFRTRKWARQRIVRGFSDWDTWDLDSFYAKTIAGSLRHLAKHTNSFPSRYNDYSKWQRAINELADLFDKVGIEPASSPEGKAAYAKFEAIYDQYRQAKGDTTSFDSDAPGYDEALTEWRSAVQKSWEDQQATLREALDKLNEYWFDLWD